MGPGAHRTLKCTAAIIVACVLAGRATAQTVQPAGVLIATFHLGGDSARSARLSLPGNQIYRLEIFPADAGVEVRPPPPERLAVPHIRRPPIAGGTAWAFLSRHGDHSVVLVTPGAATIRVIVEGLPAYAAVSPVHAPVLYRDSVVFDEVFPGPRDTVRLEQTFAYRLEITPSVGNVSLQPNTISGAAPLQLYTLANPPRGRYARLLMPPATDVYRIGLARTDTVRVRIIRDEEESALWIRRPAPANSLPRFGVAVRAVAIGPFPTDSGGLRPGIGLDFCLGAVPRGPWMGGSRLAGCVLNIAYYHRTGGNSTVAFGIAPRLVRTDPDAATQIAVGFSAAFAGIVGGREQSFLMLGIAAIADRHVAGRLLLEGEAGLTYVHNLDETHTGERSSGALAPRLALGFQLRL